MKRLKYISFMTKYLVYAVVLLTMVVSSCKIGEKYAVYQYDNGDDYFSEGLQRIVDRDGKIGFRDTIGKIIIVPQFAFAFPFKDGYAKVTDIGHNKVVDEGGEYHIWVSDTWYYVNKKGHKVDGIEKKLVESFNISPEPYVYINGEWSPYFGMSGLKRIKKDSIQSIDIKNDNYGNRAVFVELSPLLRDSIKNSRAEYFPYIDPVLIFNKGAGSIVDEKNWIESHKTVPNNFIGKVRTVVNYIVNPDGSVSDVDIFKSSGNKEVDEDAISVIKNLPPYKVVYNSPMRIPIKRTAPLTYVSLQKSYSTNDKLKMSVVNPDALKMPVDSIVVELTNTADEETTYGEWFRIEKNENGKWKKVAYNDRVQKQIDQGCEMVFHAVGYVIPPHQSRSYVNPTTAFNENIIPGRYRISKTFHYPPYPILKSDTAYVEFEIR